MVRSGCCAWVLRAVAPSDESLGAEEGERVIDAGVQGGLCRIGDQSSEQGKEDLGEDESAVGVPPEVHDGILGCEKDHEPDQPGGEDEEDDVGTLSHDLYR